MDKSKIYTLLLAILLFAGCNKVEQITTTGAKIPISLSVNSVEGAVVAPDGAKTVSLYICDQGKIVWLNRINTEISSQIDLPVEQLGDRMAYCIVNEEVCLGASELIVGDSEEKITSLLSSYDIGAGKKDLIAMCGSANLSGLDHTSTIEISLKRNMARFDIVYHNTDIAPQSIIVKGLPLKGTLFDIDNSIVPNDTYDLSEKLIYDADFRVVEGAFYSHEFEESQFKPLVEITALYGDVELKSYVDISKAKRNKRYIIYLNEIDGELIGNITSEGDMEFGDDTTIDPDEAGSKIFINPTLTKLSADVVIDSENRRITFPTKGGESTLFLTGGDVEYLGQDGSSSHLTVEAEPDGSYKLLVTPNRTIEPTDVAVVLKFIEKTQSDKEKFTRISVIIENFAPFDVTTMANVDWTPINAQGKNISSYPVLKSGSTLRGLIQSDWNKWSGTGEQWGPRPGNASNVITRFPAWFNTQWSGVSYQTLPYINGAIIGGNNLTQWDNHAYCPDGWRLPKREEFAAIWPPKGTIIDASTSPVSYTTSAGNFTVKIENIGNNCLVISDGVEELIFPLAGFREHNGIHNPGNSYDQHGRDTGSSVYYWCYDRPVGGDARVYGYEKAAVQNGANPRYTISDLSYNSSAWLTSRCVRQAKL